MMNEHKWSYEEINLEPELQSAFHIHEPPVEKHIHADMNYIGKELLISLSNVGAIDISESNGKTLIKVKKKVSNDV